jgi:Fe-Mn family superoxide dismutase
MPKVTRRQALKTAGAGAAIMAIAAASKSATAAAVAQGAQPAAGPFTLPKLPYDYNQLAPHIDERTMRIHHTLHHQAYVTGLNTALMGNEELQKQPIEQILRNVNTKVPQNIRQRVINHGGGHYNHSLFWELMSPKGGAPPKENTIAKAIASAFQSFAAFQKTFKQAALDRFGSGWTWLVLNNGRLEVISTANQDCPLMTAGQTPLLGLDVWEHAYYLNYQNRRGDYVDAWWNVVNWPAVAQRFDRAGKK